MGLEPSGLLVRDQGELELWQPFWRLEVSQPQNPQNTIGSFLGNAQFTPGTFLATVQPPAAGCTSPVFSPFRLQNILETGYLLSLRAEVPIIGHHRRALSLSECQAWRLFTEVPTERHLEGFAL